MCVCVYNMKQNLGSLQWKIKSTIQFKCARSYSLNFIARVSRICEDTHKSVHSPAGIFVEMCETCLIAWRDLQHLFSALLFAFCIVSLLLLLSFFHSFIHSISITVYIFIYAFEMNSTKISITYRFKSTFWKQKCKKRHFFHYQV